MLGLVTGCETTAPGRVSTPVAAATVTEAGSPTEVNIAFQDGSGRARAIRVPRRLPSGASRGYDAEGNFVTLGTLKGYAIEAYKSGASSREMEVRYKLNRFDGETIEIVVTALHRAGASATQPLQ